MLSECVLVLVTVSFVFGEWLTAITAATAALFILYLPADVAAEFTVVSPALSTLHFRPPNT